MSFSDFLKLMLSLGEKKSFSRGEPSLPLRGLRLIRLNLKMCILRWKSFLLYFQVFHPLCHDKIREYSRFSKSSFNFNTWMPKMDHFKSEMPNFSWIKIIHLPVSGNFIHVAFLKVDRLHGEGEVLLVMFTFFRCWRCFVILNKQFSL